MAKPVLGFNCNCFTNRYDEPEEWTALCKEMGIHYVMFNVDLIDPWWSWDVQKKLLDRTLECCNKNDVKIFCSFGGHHGHQHYLGHFDDGARAEGVKFFKNAVRQAAYLGAKSFGTCFGIQTVRTNSDPALRKDLLEKTIKAYYEVADYAAEVGLPALAYEMTSVERETCATFEENDFILERCSKMAVPMRICLDMGHRNLHGLPEEADHLAWIKKYGTMCDEIDCQQSTLTSSNHWPFTEQNNKVGIIKGDEVAKAVREIPGDQEILLGFEIKTGAFWPQEEGHLQGLRDSVNYWRQWVKD